MLQRLEGYKENYLIMSTYKILKSNDKHLIIKVKYENNTIVKKYNLLSTKNLEKEVQRINFLSKRSKKYKKYQINILDFSNEQIFYDIYKPYYSMPFLKGSTFSNIIKSTKYTLSEKKKLFKVLYDELYSLSLEQKNIESKTQKIKWLDRYAQVLKNVNNFPIISDICKNNFLINNIEINKGDKLIYNFISKGEKSFSAYNNAHANFHGENIILLNYPKNKEFLILDPDTKIENIDCSFSLARFLYTYIHDTIVNDKYKIILEQNSKNKINFNLKFKWNNKQIKSYKLLEDKILNLLLSFSKFKDSQKIIKSYILCLLTGVITNDNGLKIKNIDKKKLSINSNALFIYLYLLLILKKFDF